MSTQVRKDMVDLCGDKPWKIITGEASASTVNSVLYEVSFGDDDPTLSLIVFAPLERRGLYITKTRPIDSGDITFALTQWGSVFNAITRFYNKEIGHAKA